MSKSGKPYRIQGFSLIEVLISIVILAFGVLAMGGLQLASLRSNQVSAYSSTAATLAKDYSEMMRSNFTVSNIVTATAGVNPYLFDTANAGSYTATPAAALCKAATCTKAQVAVLHVADWAQRVKDQLPEGRAVVCRDSTPRNSDGTFKWACDGLGTYSSIKLGWVDKRSQVEQGTATFTIANPQMVMVGLTGFVE
jgi:type IV pilus assembly protein PilV